MTKPTAKLGRPEKGLDPRALALAARCGKSQEDAAAACGVSLSTLKRCLLADPSLRMVWDSASAEAAARREAASVVYAKQSPNLDGSRLALKIKRDVASNLDRVAAERGESRHAFAVAAIMAAIEAHDAEAANAVDDLQLAA